MIKNDLIGKSYLNQLNNVKLQMGYLKAYKNNSQALKTLNYQYVTLLKLLMRDYPELLI